MFSLSLWLSRKQKSVKDYFLAGNRTGPLPIALSTTATQCSTNSLLGAPAFVAFSGGLLWLQYELAVPLAMAVLLLVIMPVFRGLNLVSVYGYLEDRFGLETRTAMSVLFQFLRAFSTGVTVYALALVLQHIMGLNYWTAVLLVGVFTVVYDFLGGIRAVIYSDVVQLVVLLGSIFLGIFIGVKAVGGWEAVFTFAEPDTLRTLDWKGHGFGDGATYSLWPMLFGGLFLYVSYYGCDQTQIQRELSSRSVNHSRISLIIGGVVRFPLVFSYCLLGVVLASFLHLNPDFGEQLYRVESVNGVQESVRDNNLLVPAFVGTFFPVGLVGLFLAGLLAAAMSSLDSTINSLSALTLHDLIERYRKEPLSEKKAFWIAKALTLFWGAVCIGFSFVVADISDTVIESVNKIGSLINGPLLAVFLLGILTRRSHQAGVLIGLVAGFLTNLALWKWAEGVSWLWWNVIGFCVTAAVGYLGSLVLPRRVNAAASNPKLYASKGNPAFADDQRRWLYAAGFLLLYGMLLLVFLGVFPGLTNRLNGS
jgi:SSS family solute:Na+ symporter